MPTDELLREGSPPPGSNSSPIPQWWDATAGWGRLFRQRVASITTGSVSVSTTAVELKVGTTAVANRLRLRAFNSGTDAVFIGASTVTTTTGYPLLPGHERLWEFDAANAVAVYAISGSSQTVLVMEEA